MLPEILKVSVEGGESVFVPLTPVTTFKDVSACVREPGDPLPLILEESPLGARVVPGWERPLELLRLWGDFKEQVNYNASFSLSRHLKDESYLKEDSRLRARSRTPDATAMKYGNIDPWELYELRDDLKDLLQHDLSYLNGSFSQPESNDDLDFRESNITAKYKLPFGGESSSDNDHYINNSDIFNTGFISKSTYSKIKNTSAYVQNNSPDSRHSSIIDSNKENEESTTRDTDESHLHWTSFNSHTKDKRYRKRIRKSHMTEQEQNNHLQNLLQESRLASIYGSPFRRGSIQTCSFPSNSAKQYDLKRLNGKNQEHRRVISGSDLGTKDRIKVISQNEKEKKFNNLEKSTEHNSSVNKNLILKECANQGSPYNRIHMSNYSSEPVMNNLHIPKPSPEITLTNVPFKRNPKNTCRSPDCHSRNLSPYQTHRISLTSNSNSSLLQQSNFPVSSRESLQTDLETTQRDSNFTSRDAEASLSPYVMSPHYLSQLQNQVVHTTVPLSPPHTKVGPTGGQKLYRNAPSHSSLRYTMSLKDTSHLQFNQSQFGNPENISSKISDTLKHSPSLNKDQVKKDLSQSEQTSTSIGFRFFNKFPNKSTKEGDKNLSRQEVNASESQTLFKPSHNLESFSQKPLSPKLKLKTMSPKQLKKGKKKVEELVRDAKTQQQEEPHKSSLNNKAHTKFFFQNKTNKIESSSRNDKQELISNKNSPENDEQCDTRSSNLIRKSILRNTLFSSGTSSSSTTSSSLSTLGSEPKSYKKYLSSFNEKSTNQHKIVPASKEMLKRHNSIPTICNPNLKSTLRSAVQVTSSSSDLLDSSSENDEDELSLSLAHRQHKLLSYKERVKLSPRSNRPMHNENLQNKNSAKNLLFRKMVKDIPSSSDKVPDCNNARIILANSRLSQRKSRSKHRNMECDHRRSCSDPLYEYLEENRKIERRRRHSGGAIPANNEGMKDSQSHPQLIPESGDLTVNELREMATRQQQHIESQQQLLVAREQRLKYLKQQEGRTSQVNMETERLRRLRERVEAQEAKLRRLRALRGQVDNSRLNAASLYSDLDAMRHLFSEKEKELVDAAAKVEELTRQLEDVRGGRGISSSTQNGSVTSTSQLQIHHQELEKLRRELLYRNSVNREASSRVSSQREALTTRKDEIARIDKRIAELTQRLHRKRVLNQQLTTQISAATQAKQAQLKAVQQKAIRDGKNDHSADGVNIEDHTTLEDISQFDRGKHDPKYQTLPYNTKFSSGVKGGGPGSGGHRSNYENAGSENESNGSSSDSNPPLQSASVVNNIRNNGLAVSTSSSSASVITNSSSASNGSNSNLGVITSTVHSIPAHLATKGHALAPPQTSQSGLPSYAPPSAPVTQNFMARGQNGNAVGSMSSNQSGLSSSQLYHQKLQPDSCQPVPVSSSIQKVNPALTMQQNRNSVVPSVHPSQNISNKDVENVRAYPPAPPPPMMPNPPHTLGYQASSSTIASHQSSISNVASSKTFQPGIVPSASSPEDTQDENSDQTNGKLKPILPPKPVVPNKPTPPPRQKGDPMASSTESINLIGVSNHRSSSSNRPQVFRYASQNVILSTYTQQQQLANQQQQTSSLSREAQSNKATPMTNQINQSSEKQNQDPSKSKPVISKESTAISEPGDDNSGASEKVHVSINRRIEMPPDFLFPEDAAPPSDLLGRQLDDSVRADRPEVRGRSSELIDENKHTPADDVRSVPSSADPKLRLDENSKEDSSENNSFDTTDRINVSNHINVNNNNNNNLSNMFNNGVNNLNVANNNINATNKDMERLRIEEGEKGDLDSEFEKFSDEIETEQRSAPSSNVVRRLKKGNLKTTNSSRVPRRVSFDPLALLLDASLEGELELVKRTATEVPNPSAANDEGITALHNAICAGHLDIVTFLVTFGCDVNAQDSDGWTPLHCAASCNNVAMVRFLVEHGACVLATTLSDHETAAEKCEQDEEGYDGCSQYLYSVQEKLGIMNGGGVYAVYEYDAQNDDELSFKCGDSLTVIRRGDEYERDWWWVRLNDKCGYVPRNLLGLYPRVKNPLKTS